MFHFLSSLTKNETPDKRKYKILPYKKPIIKHHNTRYKKHDKKQQMK